jgi:co-chaperonin GroES (HSP10)
MSKNDLRDFVAFDPARIKFVARDKVIVRRQPTKFKVGAIHIPENSRYLDREDRADVIAVGSGVSGFAKGDVVLLPDVLDVLGKFSHDGMTYSIVHKDHIQAVCDD